GEKPRGAELDELSRKVIARAQRAGALRGDLEPAEVGPLIRAALMAAPPGHWRLYLDVVLDGLRS
ncbi:MAG TPA: hypothetical protein VFL58_10625, partial [Gaiellaceae bacterium]|nr:hypothetical protein [Gaiellaceae bacterium]